MNSKQSRGRRSLGEVFRVPLWLGVLSAVGLVSALIADGWFDWFSSAALATPLLVIAWQLRQRTL